MPDLSRCIWHFTGVLCALVCLNFYCVCPTRGGVCARIYVNIECQCVINLSGSTNLSYLAWYSHAAELQVLTEFTKCNGLQM